MRLGKAVACYRTEQATLKGVGGFSEPQMRLIGVVRAKTKTAVGQKCVVRASGHTGDKVDRLTKLLLQTIRFFFNFSYEKSSY